MMTVRIVRYSPAMAGSWNEFVKDAKNGLFLFYRGYMDYHADRFADHSLLFFRDEKLIAILPANEREGCLYSHAGLTFGGLVSSPRTKTAAMLEIVSGLIQYLRMQGITRLAYKKVPHIYHGTPAEEDLYALFRHGAALVRRDVSATIWMSDRRVLPKGRKASIKRGSRGGIEVRRSLDFERFMAMAKAQLQQRHGVQPTHTGPEMQLLAERFPDSIKLFGAYQGDELLGGVIVYESPRVAHVQYMASAPEGRELGVVDGVIDVLLNETYAAVPYFDFGISTEDQGRHLNAGLAAYKESYGARAVVYDSYELEIR